METLSRRALCRPLVSVLFTACAFAAGAALLFGLRIKFISTVDKEKIETTATLPARTSLEYRDRLGKSLAKKAIDSGLVAAAMLRCVGDGDDPYFLDDSAELP